MLDADAFLQNPDPCFQVGFGGVPTVWGGVKSPQSGWGDVLGNGVGDSEEENGWNQETWRAFCVYRREECTFF